MWNILFRTTCFKHIAIMTDWFIYIVHTPTVEADGGIALVKRTDPSF